MIIYFSKHQQRKFFVCKTIDCIYLYTVDKSKMILTKKSIEPVLLFLKSDISRSFFFITSKLLNTAYENGVIWNVSSTNLTSLQFYSCRMHNTQKIDWCKLGFRPEFYHTAVEKTIYYVWCCKFDQWILSIKETRFISQIGRHHLIYFNI